jgi:hypothetical protein
VRSTHAKRVRGIGFSALIAGPRKALRQAFWAPQQVKLLLEF